MIEQLGMLLQLFVLFVCSIFILLSQERWLYILEKSVPT